MNDNNWLGYEVGDDVYIFTHRYGHSHISGPHKVTKVTATGRITLSNKDQFLNRGNRVGSGPYVGAYVWRKSEQAERLEATKSAIREQNMKNKLRTFREQMTIASDKEERLALAASLEAMAAELRAFDNAR